MNDPAFRPLDPAHLPLPDKLLRAITKAQRVLIVSHGQAVQAHTGSGASASNVQSDPDAVGTALALKRGLGALGKTVDICIDAELPGSLRMLDAHHDIKRATDLLGHDWDLALIVDVSVPSRMSAANALLLPHAKAVAIVDHHEANPHAKEFNLAPEAAFLRWMEPDFPAAALMAGAILSRFAPAIAATGTDLTDVYTPALCGFSTDTGWGQIQGLDTRYFRYYKHMLNAGSGTHLGALRKILTSFTLPARVTALANHALTPEAANLPNALARTLMELEANGQAFTTHTYVDAHGKPSVQLATLTLAYRQALQAVGHLDHVKLTLDDLLPPFVVKHQQAMTDGNVRLSAFIAETENNQVYCSLRSPGEPLALTLAKRLQGGGHERMAGAQVSGQSLQEVQAQIETWATNQGLMVPVAVAPDSLHTPPKP